MAKMAKKSVVATLGCNECTYFSAMKNCIKVGFSTRDINEGKWVHTESKGSFRLDSIKRCPMKKTHAQVKIENNRKKTIEEAKAGVLKRMPNSGLIG